MAFGVFQFRRGTAAQWTAANTVLASGELGLETDTAKFKIGNGTTAWNSLPYGGIKGDTGATGAAGVSPTVTVGATTVVTPVTNPSVTDADAGANADFRFSLPRARNVTAGTTTTGAAGTSASVSSAQDANGDVTLTFTIPRGDTGVQGVQGPTGPAANAFTNIAVAGQTTVSAEVANDTLTITNGTGIAVTTDAANDAITITNNDTGSSARTAHEAAADPHPQYLTQTEGDARYQLAGASNIKILSTSANLTANTAFTLSHNLALTNKDSFVIRTALSDGSDVDVRVASVNQNSLTLTAAVAVTGLLVTILGF